MLIFGIRVDNQEGSKHSLPSPKKEQITQAPQFYFDFLICAANLLVKAPPVKCQSPCVSSENLGYQSAVEEILESSQAWLRPNG